MILNKKIVTIGLVAVIGWLGHGAWKLHLQRSDVQVQVKDLASKLSHLTEENRFLASASAYFKSDEFLEKQARLKLNYKLPDENIAFVYPDKSEMVASASASESVWSFSYWQSWLKKLFNK